MKKPRMIRLMMMLVLLGLLGLVTSVTVAWGIALLPFSEESESRPFRMNGWAGTVKYSKTEMWYGAHSENANDWGADGRPENSPSNPAPIYTWVGLDEPPFGVYSWLDAYASGWPRPCLAGVIRERESGVVPSYAFRISGTGPSSEPTENLWWFGAPRRGIFEGKNPQSGGLFKLLEARYLPAEIIWSGMLFNSVIFGVGWLLLISPLFLGRQYILHQRIKKSLCVFCRYDLSSSNGDRCSECGRKRTERPQVITGVFLLGLTFVLMMHTGAIVVFGMIFAREKPYAEIHHAAIEGDVQRLESLLDAGVDVDLPIPADSNPPGFTALQIAAGSGHDQAVALLLDHGADIERSDQFGTTPLLLAVRAKDVKLVRFFISRGAIVDLHPPILMSPLAYACALGHWEMIEMLIEAGASINQLDPNEYFMPLAVCIRSEHDNIARRLLELGAEVNQTAMNAAANREGSESLRMLVEYGADLRLQNEDGETLLFRMYIDPKAMEVWEYLLEAGVDVNKRDNEGMTALMKAVSYYEIEKATYLIEYGANPTLQNEAGETAMDLADDEIFKEIIRLAIEKWEAEHREEEP